MRIDWSLRAKSMDLILRSRFFLARTFFSEFFMWWVCVALISRSIPLDCIFLCKTVSALSRSPEITFTLIPRSCCNWYWLARVTSPVTRFAIVFIFPRNVIPSLDFCKTEFWNHGWETERETIGSEFDLPVTLWVGISPEVSKSQLTTDDGECLGFFKRALLIRAMEENETKIREFMGGYVIITSFRDGFVNTR